MANHTVILSDTQIAKIIAGLELLPSEPIAVELSAMPEEEFLRPTNPTVLIDLFQSLLVKDQSDAVNSFVM